MQITTESIIMAKKKKEVIEKFIHEIHSTINCGDVYVSSINMRLEKSSKFRSELHKFFPFGHFRTFLQGYYRKLNIKREFMMYDILINLII